MQLEKRKILITGGSAGIGQQLAADLIERGAQVLVCGRKSARLEQMASSHPKVQTFVCDVRNYDDVLRLRAFTLQSFGAPDVLLNNAAVFRRFEISAPDKPVDDWLDEVDINLMGTLRMTHAFLPAMKTLPEAVIINVTSPSAYLPLAAAPIYSATKAALQSWTISLRHQLRDSSVSAIELNPPVVDTRMNKNNPDVEGLKLWSIKEFSEHVIDRLERSGAKDILVGDAKFVRTMSRIVPSLVFKKMNPA